MSFFDRVYGKAIKGLPGLPTAHELADGYLKGEGTLEEKVNSLVLRQELKCATSGFIFGLGGLATTPITLPANIASVIYFQVRMIAAIAYMTGHDVNDEKVKRLVYTCLCGNVAKEIIEEAGIKMAARMASKAAGNRGFVKLARGIPFLGGIIGASFDFATTRAISNAAKLEFLGTVKQLTK